MSGLSAAGEMSEDALGSRSFLEHVLVVSAPERERGGGEQEYGAGDPNNPGEQRRGCRVPPE